MFVSLCVCFTSAFVYQSMTTCDKKKITLLICSLVLFCSLQPSIFGTIAKDKPNKDDSKRVSTLFFIFLHPLWSFLNIYTSHYRVSNTHCVCVHCSCHDSTEITCWNADNWKIMNDYDHRIIGSCTGVTRLMQIKWGEGPYPEILHNQCRGLRASPLEMQLLSKF